VYGLGKRRISWILDEDIRPPWGRVAGGAEGIRTSDLLGAGTPPARVEEAAASKVNTAERASGSGPKRMIFSAVRRSIVARSSQNAHEEGACHNPVAGCGPSRRRDE
jgi:hypothetical protein